MAGILCMCKAFEGLKKVSIMILPFVNLCDNLSEPLWLQLISYKPQSYTKDFTKATKGFY